MKKTIDRHEAEYIAYELNRAMYNVKDVNAVETLNNCLAEFGEGESWGTVTSEGLTLLHITASYDSLESVKTLIGLGVNPNAQDQDGNTFVHHAFNLLGIMDYADQDCRVVQWMAENGYDMNVKNKFGQTPLFLLGRHLTKMIEKDGIRDIREEFQGREQEMIAALVARFELLGGDFYHKDDQGRTFVDVFPVHPDFVGFNDLLDGWKIKMQRHNIEQEIGGLDQKKVAHKKM